MITTDSQTLEAMFDRLSRRYDRFNRISSLGMDHLWRSKTLRKVKPGMRILDVGTGTGELAIEALRRLEGRGEVVALDFSKRMLHLAEEKSGRLRLQGRIRWVLRKAEEIPFEEAPYDLVVSGFVLRNLAANIQSVIRGIFASLKEGGGIAFVDLTAPKNTLVKEMAFLYLKFIVGFWGRTMFNESYPTQYLRHSAGAFLRADEFKKLLEKTGFENIELESFLGGIVTLYTAAKPTAGRN